MMCHVQVRWCASSNDDHPRFCSAGDDGKLIRWTCIRGELRHVLVLELPSAITGKQLDDGTRILLPGYIRHVRVNRVHLPLTSLAPAIAMDFHRQHRDSFLVGTDHGKIYKASVNDPGIIHLTLDAHDFVVYAVQWR
jgi:hypothetical protein